VKNVLGVSALYHDSAAALVSGGAITAAAQEERFSRQKHDRRFPNAAIAFCRSRLEPGARLDGVAYYEDPVLSFDRVLRSTIDTAPASERAWQDAAVSQLTEKLAVLEELQTLAPGAEMFIVDHHMSHLASAYYPSPFEEAAIVVVDGVGEWATTTIAHGRQAAITPLAQIHYPHSLGLFYSAFTYHCGLKVNSGEYKLMGLAPYGRPIFTDLILERMLDLRQDGSFRLDTRYFGYPAGRAATSPAFEALFGCPRRAPSDRLTRIYMDLAASAQRVVERVMQAIVEEAIRRTGCGALCLAGGVALNCVSNGKLLREVAGLRRVWVQPAAGDAGGALGAALHVAHHHFGARRHDDIGRGDGQKGSLLGPAFDEASVLAALKDAGLRWRLPGDEAAFTEAVAEALAEGLIVARFDGAMEFGPRALGNRSILADARRVDGQSHINRSIKFRESWRPFAPVVLAEHAADYFELADESPYMLLVADVREELRKAADWSGFEASDGDMLEVLNQLRSSIPAVTHVDYSARVQTVDATRNPKFHALLARFHAITGCPVLVNTSFNVRGEPIVCTPADAVRCFCATGIDVLAIGTVLVFRADQSEQIRNHREEPSGEPD
jgi:carbamoyltransferase